MEGIRQRAVYSYTTSKTTKNEASSMAIKELRLPDSFKRLEEEEALSNKSLALDKQNVEKKNKIKMRYEQSISRNTVERSRNSFN